MSPRVHEQEVWEQAIQAERDKCKARRLRVLAFPDIAIKLTRPPMRFKFPDQWSGYIPPFNETGPNVVRDYLIDICKQVAAAEQLAADGSPIETPSSPGTISRGQLSKLHILFKEAGITERTEYLGYCQATVDREIESTTTLSYNEAGQVISALNRLIHPGEEY